MLGRMKRFDEKSREYDIRPLLAPIRPQTDKVWKMPQQMPLDQGQEGACVGFGWCAELASEPIMYNTTDEYAFSYYRAARRVDKADGNDWPEGASVLAGAKVARGSGMIKEYRWAFSVQDIISTLFQKGPVVLGVNWYSDMYSTDLRGLVQVGGELVGGHCITAYGYHPNHPLFGECIRWMNSWGRSYGMNGVGYLRRADLERLMGEGGEACIATDTIARR